MLTSISSTFKEESKSYRLGSTWESVNEDRICTFRIVWERFPLNVLFIEQIVFAPRLSSQILLEIEYHVFFL